MWLSMRDDLARTRVELDALKSANAELKQSNDRVADTVKDLAAALAASAATAQAAGAGGTPGDAAGGATGLLRSELVPYGELPFDRGRVDALRDVLAKLEAQGFRGVVRATSLAGLFCLSGNATDGYAPAAAALPASKCDLIGNPFEDALSGQQRQSIAFANLVAGVRQRTSGAITVVADSAAAPGVSPPYPPRSDSLTAGEWNKAAAANNRVEFAAEPGPGP
jgi:hypothetical protein